jgi:hypothetical protein
MIETSARPEPEGIIALHAAAVCVEGEAVLFLGPPNTGKSTVRRMLAEHTQSLADDGVYIVVTNPTQWSVAQAEHRPFSHPLSKEEARQLPSFPLKAIFRIYQSPAPLIQPIGRLLLCKYLVGAFFEIMRQREYDVLIKRLVFSHLARLAKVVPGYEFYFNCTPLSSDIFFEALKSLSV